MPASLSFSSANALTKLAHGPDQQAWAGLVHTHGDSVLRLCMRILGDRTLAEDACQETFLNVRNRAQTFLGLSDDPERSARAWIRQIACRVSLIILRQRGLSKLHERQAGEAMKGGAMTQSTADDRDDGLLDAVRRELAALDERNRQPIVLQYFAGLDNREIARELGCSLENARVRVHRGLERLRRRMARAGVTVTSALLISAVMKAEAIDIQAPQLLNQLAADTGTVPSITLTQGLGLMAKLSIGAVLSAATLIGSIALHSAASESSPRPKDKPAAKQEMPAWRKGLPVGKLTAIPGTAPSKFDLRPSWSKASNGAPCWEKRIFEDWCGFQTDEKRSVIYSALGGGHASCEQNGVYQIDLMQPQLVWSTVRESTEHVPFAPENQNTAYFKDGRPTARHTYMDGHVIEIDGKPVIVMVTNLANTYTATGGPRATDAFYIEKKDWALNGAGWQTIPGGVGYGDANAKDPRTQRIYVLDNRGAVLYLDPTTRTWTTVAGTGLIISGVGTLLDVKRDRIVMSGKPKSPTKQFVILNMKNWQAETKTLSGPGLPHVMAFSEGEPFHSGTYSGFVHDTINDRYLCVSVSGKITAVDPDTFAVTVVCDAPVPAQWSVCNRFAFLPHLQGVVYLPEWNSDMLFLPVK
jgi:RNA polymerase sigma factor (sigma-70 family)